MAVVGLRGGDPRPFFSRQERSTIGKKAQPAPGRPRHAARSSLPRYLWPGRYCTSGTNRNVASSRPGLAGEETGMIENPPVLTIHRGHRRPDRALLEAFRGAQTSHLVDAMEGRGALDWRIKPLDPANANFTGPALTAHAYPADFFGGAGAAMEAEPGGGIMCANEKYTC